MKNWAVQPEAIAEKFVEDHPSLGSHAAWARQFLVWFPVPRVDVALPVFESCQRILQSVPWVSAALDDSARSAVPEIVRQLSTSSLSRRGMAQDTLTGDFLLAGTLVGRELQPMRGPEGLRAVLWLCRMRWASSGKPRASAIGVLASAIRDAVKFRDAASTAKHPVASHFAALDTASTLAEFVDAAAVLKTCDHQALSRAWRRHFEPELRGILSDMPVVGAGTAATPSHGKKGGGSTGIVDEDDDLEAMRTHIRVVQVAPAGYLDLAEGEPLAEIQSSHVITPAMGPENHPDGRRMARYAAVQAIWNQNWLFLTNHPDVLSMANLRVVVRALLQELHHGVDDSDLALGLGALLLQAMTGRSAARLIRLAVVAPSAAEPGIDEWQLRLDESVIRLGIFWHGLRQGRGDERVSYFMPSPSQAGRLEPVQPTLDLPLDREIVDGFRHGAWLPRLAKTPVESLDAYLREAVRHLSRRIGFSFHAGQVRRSFAVHVFDHCRDTAMTQLICGDTLGQSIAPLHYYAPRVGSIARVYSETVRAILGISGGSNERVDEGERVGAATLVGYSDARDMVTDLPRLWPTQVVRMMTKGQWAEVHRVMVVRMGCMLLAAVGHRPVDALFRVTLNDVDLEVGAALIRDKVHDQAHDPRLVVLPTCVVDQLRAYLSHLVGMARNQKALASHVNQVRHGSKPLLFEISAHGKPSTLRMARFRRWLPDSWLSIPLNWGRTWIRTRSVEMGLSPEFASMQLGHLEAVGYPFSNGSPTEPLVFVEACRPVFDKVARDQGWRVMRGIPVDHQDPRPPLEPLRAWAKAIEACQRSTDLDAKRERVERRARLNSCRRQAETDVLADPMIAATGIADVYRQTGIRTLKPTLDPEALEQACDRLVDQAGGDDALAVARVDALRRILRTVNRRSDVHYHIPSSRFTFRRRVDNAFLPGMMCAIRQVRALRQWVVELSRQAPGDWRNFGLACARGVLGLTLFGFMDDAGQVLGVLQRRHQLKRSATLDDAILVPWGEATHEVLAVRGLAAIALARLAKKYRNPSIPSRVDINRALIRLLPDWAVSLRARHSLEQGAAQGDGSDCAVPDVLGFLCQTVSVSNRWELSPAARLVRDPVAGSVPASLDEQLAMLDADPVGSLRRETEASLADRSAQRGLVQAKSTGNARSQYLALCQVIPQKGADLELPVTGIRIPADQLFNDSTRPKVVAELRQQLATPDPKVMPQPIVMALMTWVVDMLEHGTKERAHPEDSTIYTYLTRIGGSLTWTFGGQSMDDMGDAELEDAYLAAVESSDSMRSQAASAILSFHACCVRYLGFPELDLSEVRLHLRTNQRSVDSELILPLERDAAVRYLEESTGNPPGEDDLDNTRVRRQASAAMALYAYTGARRSEVLGLKFADVQWADGQLLVRIRANRSRRLKTFSARRSLDTTAIPAHVQKGFTRWEGMDKSRLSTWRRENAYVFSPLEDGRKAKGRGAVADACKVALAQATGRATERLHRLRHLVAFQRVIPLFLASRDLTVLKPTALHPDASSVKASIVFPRDLMEAVVPLGHKHWTTTLTCYCHMPWLLRSRRDVWLSDKYLSRRTVAALMGVRLVTVDQILQRAKGAGEAHVWMDHVCKSRVVPDRPTQDVFPKSPGVMRKWTAGQLLTLLDLTMSTGTLANALAVIGASDEQAAQIEFAFAPFEQHLGRRLIAGPRQEALDLPKWKVRRAAAAGKLDALCTFFDDVDSERRDDLMRLSEAVYDWMRPKDQDWIRVPSDVYPNLVDCLQAVEISADAIESMPLPSGIRKVRLHARQRDEAGLDRKSDLRAARQRRMGSAIHLGLSLKRVLGVIWVAARLLRTESSSNSQ